MKSTDRYAKISILTLVLISIVIPRSSAAVGCAVATFDYQEYPDSADAMRSTAQDLAPYIAKANTHCGSNSY